MADIGQGMEYVDMNHLTGDTPAVEDLSRIGEALHLGFIWTSRIDYVHSARHQGGLAHSHSQPTIKPAVDLGGKRLKLVRLQIRSSSANTTFGPTWTMGRAIPGGQTSVTALSDARPESVPAPAPDPALAPAPALRRPNEPAVAPTPPA